MAEYEIEGDDVLTKVNRYELDREKDLGRIIIDVHQILSAEKKGTYFAVPNLILRHAKDQYITSGSTEDEALKECLKCIKGVRIEDILEDFEGNKAESEHTPVQ